MENHSRTALLDAGLALLAERGARGLTLRAVEDQAGLAHGSVRHYFKDRRGLIAALFDHLANSEQALAQSGDVVAALHHWLGAGRPLTLARYELFLLAARDPPLRAPLLEGRNRFVAIVAERLGEAAAPTIVAALDGILLDALIRDTSDSAQLSDAVRHLTSSKTSGAASG